MTSSQKRERRQRREKIPRFELADALRVVGEFKDCRQRDDNHWQGTDVDGSVITVRGGLMPPYLVVETGQGRPLPNDWGFSHWGIIRLIKAETV